MIILTTYLTIGLVFAICVFGGCTAANKWEGIREGFEERFPEFNFRIIIAVVYVLYIAIWPFWLILYCKDNV